MIWAIRQVIPKLFAPLHRDRKDIECPQYYIKEGGIYWFQSLKALTLCLYSATLIPPTALLLHFLLRLSDPVASMLI